jgi:predicted lactoylglutathione lyase
MKTRRVVVDHVLFVVDDLAASRRLYTAAHVAFDAADRKSVDAFFQAAMANGAAARGEPGVWAHYSDRYYAAFVNDLHGNNVEAVWHAPEEVAGAPVHRGVP